jgi:hypothetical protein
MVYLCNVYPCGDDLGSLTGPNIWIHEYSADDTQRDSIKLIDRGKNSGCLVAPILVTPGPYGTKTLVWHQFLE